MNVLHVASEVAPFSKTGGLGDVLAALPRALAQQGANRVTVVSARYGSVDPQRHGLAKRLRKLTVNVGGQHFEVGLFEGRLPGPWRSQVTVYLVDHPLFSDRPGVYGPPSNPGEGYPDNALRFALLSQAAISLARGAEPSARCHPRARLASRAGGVLRAAGRVGNAASDGVYRS